MGKPPGLLLRFWGSMILTVTNVDKHSVQYSHHKKSSICVLVMCGFSCVDLLLVCLFVGLFQRSNEVVMLSSRQGAANGQQIRSVFG
jgi:hypothetical protein